MRWCWLISIALCVPTMAHADTLVLKDGQTFQGIVTEQGDEVSVRLDIGTVSFSSNEVESITRGLTKLQALDQKTTALGARDLPGTIRLARWAEQEGLDHGARDLYKRALTIDPNNEVAHRALGHERHEGRWLTTNEYLVATGHVRYGGRWVTTEEAAALEADAHKRRDRREARARAEAQARVDAEHAAKQRALEARVKDLEEEDRSSPFVWAWGGYGWLPNQPQVRPIPKQRVGQKRKGRIGLGTTVVRKSFPPLLDVTPKR